MKRKPYRNIIFSGKNVPYDGISDGKGPLFRGKNVEFSLNLSYITNIDAREGQATESEYVNSILNVGIFNSETICEGNNIWSEET